MHIPLYRIAHVRSGDKGNTALMGVFAYSADLYPILVEQVTIASIKATFGAAVNGPITRYEVPAIHALNFTLDGALGGGVSRSLSLDNFGKALCSRILGVELDIPDNLMNHLASER
jgi:hypothetical protein